MNGNAPIRWRRPPGPVLRREVFATDTPPFYPFPDVSQVTKGYCPVAILHDLFWGRDFLGRRDTWVGGKIGELYHKLVGRFRRDIAAGRRQVNHVTDRQIAGGLAQEYFESFTERRAIAPADIDQLRDLFNRYVLRKAADGGLRDLTGTRVLTEVEMANPRCRFQFADGTVHYPLRGRADEINIDQGVIIERTLEADPINPNQPPRYKLYQTWLYRVLIETLEGHRRPPALANLWQQPIRMIVETPDQDFEVTPEPDFLAVVERAYYWIHNIFRGVRHGSIYDEAACTIEHPDESCSHCRTDCFTRSYSYPTRQDEIRRLCRRYARAFLYERVWNYDLWFYRQCWLPLAILENDGEMIPGEIRGIEANRVQIEMDSSVANTIARSRNLIGIPSATGSFFVGHRIRLQPVHSTLATHGERTVISFNVPSSELEQLHDVTQIAIVSSNDEELLFTEMPLALQDFDRSRLARLMKKGVQSLNTAQRSGVIRAMRLMTGELQPVRQGRLFD